MSGTDLKPRMLALAASMRELAADLDAAGTEADRKPDGWREAHRLIQAANVLAAVAAQLERGHE